MEEAPDSMYAILTKPLPPLGDGVQHYVTLQEFSDSLANLIKNIYNANGTLAGFRDVDLSVYDLDFIDDLGDKITIDGSILSVNNSGGANYEIQTTGTQAIVGTLTNHPLLFQTNLTEVARFKETGEFNLTGVGNDEDASKFLVLDGSDDVHYRDEDGLISGSPFFWGSTTESVRFDVTSDGVTVTASIEQNGGGDIDFLFSDGLYTYDATPAATVTLTAGSDASPQINYVYVLQSDKTLYASTTGFPSDEYAPIGTVLVQTASDAQTNGLYKVHAWTDHLNSTNGHLGHLNYWIRNQPASYVSGVTWDLNDVPDDEIWVDVTSGTVLQLHPHTFPAFTDRLNFDYKVVNHPTAAYTNVNEISDVLLDSGGGSLSGDYYTVVVWGVISEDTEDCHLFINLPDGGYSNQEDAELDIDGYTVYDIPTDFLGTGFLIAEFLLKHSPSGGGSWISIRETDLRGKNPGSVSGGGGGSQVEFADNEFVVFDNVDDTKKLQFENSGITAGETSLITIPDKDGTMALIDDVVFEDTGTEISLKAAHSTDDVSLHDILLVDQSTTRVGINNTSPTTDLEIGDGVTGQPYMQINTSLAGYDYMKYQAWGLEASETNNFMFIRSAVDNTGHLQFGFNGRDWNYITSFADQDHTWYVDGFERLRLNTTGVKMVALSEDATENTIMVYDASGFVNYKESTDFNLSNFTDDIGYLTTSDIWQESGGIVSLQTASNNLEIGRTDLTAEANTVGWGLNLISNNGLSRTELTTLDGGGFRLRANTGADAIKVEGSGEITITPFSQATVSGQLVVSSVPTETTSSLLTYGTGGVVSQRTLGSINVSEFPNDAGYLTSQNWTRNGTGNYLYTTVLNDKVSIGLVSAPNEQLQVNGAINIGTTTNTNDGTIRWNGTNYQGYVTGSGWLNLDEQAATETDPIYIADPAFTITNTDITNWNSAINIWERNGTTISNANEGDIVELRSNTAANYGYVGALDFYNTNVNADRKIAKIEAQRGLNSFDAGRLSFQTADGTGTLQEVVVIDRYERVGINVVNPTATLDVSGQTRLTQSSAVYSLKVEGGSNNTNEGATLLVDDNTTGGGVNVGGSVAFRGEDSGGTQRTYAMIKGGKVSSGTNFDGYLAFHTRQNAQADSDEAMRIDEDGNIGVGITSPSKQFHMRNSGNAEMFIQSTSTTGGAWIDMRNADEYYRVGVNTTDDFVFQDINGSFNIATFDATYKNLNITRGIKFSSTDSTTVGDTNGTVFWDGSDLYCIVGGLNTSLTSGTGGGGTADGNGIYEGSNNGSNAAVTSLGITTFLNIDSGTLYIDGANNEIGIGTVTPARTFHVNGNVRLDGLATSGTYHRFLAVESDGDVYEYNFSEVDGSVTNEAWTIDGDDADTEVISNQTVKFEGGTGITTDYNPATNTLLINSSGSDSDWLSGTGLWYNNTDDIIIGGNTNDNASTSYPLEIHSKSTAQAGIYFAANVGREGVLYMSDEFVVGDVTFPLQVHLDAPNNSLSVLSTGQLNLSGYASGGTFIGTAAKMIGVDASGNVVMNDVPSAASEVNDLSSIVTWANVPDANITESSVTQHKAAMISDAAYDASWNGDTNGATKNAIYDKIETITGDGDGIYDGSGTVPTTTAVTLIDNINFDGNTFYIDGTNNEIGIGTNTPSATLDIVGDTELNGSLELRDGGIGQFYFDVVNTELGVGTVTPTQALEVVGTTKTDDLVVDNRAWGAFYTTTDGSSTTSTFAKIDFTTQLKEEGQVTVDETTNDRITVNADGDYRITLIAELDNDGTSTQGQFSMYKNGIPLLEHEFHWIIHQGTNIASKHMSKVLTLSDGDYLEVWWRNVSATSTSRYKYVELEVIREVGY